MRSTVSRRTVLQGSAGFVSALGAVSASSCAEERSPSGRLRTEIDARIPFTFLAVVPPNSLTFTPELVADAAGFFSGEGLDVTIEVTRGSAQAIQLILAGRAPLTRISQIDGMRAAAHRGAPLINVASVMKGSTIRYVSSLQTPLREPQDFVGKTIGIPSEGGSSDLELDVLLAASGIDPERVARQVVGLTPAVFDLVKQGRIAGYAVSIDTANVLEQRHTDAIVLDPGEFITSGGQIYVTSRKGLTEHREAIGRYLRAVRAAIEFIIDDDAFDRTLGILRQHYDFDALEDTFIAKKSLKEYVGVWALGGRESVLLTDSERWASGHQELVRVGFVEHGANAEQWFTNELVEKL